MKFSNFPAKELFPHIHQIHISQFAVFIIFMRFMDGEKKDLQARSRKKKKDTFEQLNNQLLSQCFNEPSI